jgi:hypothetical protein
MSIHKYPYTYTYNLFNPLLALLTATLGFTTGAGTELTTLTGLLIFPSSNLPSFSFSIIGLCSWDAWACRGVGLIEEVDVEDDIEIEVGREGRGFEGGAEDFMDVEEDVSRNSGGGIWESVRWSAGSEGNSPLE